jgi:hypothetical protein
MFKNGDVVVVSDNSERGHPVGSVCVVVRDTDQKSLILKKGDETYYHNADNLTLFEPEK